MLCRFHIFSAPCDLIIHSIKVKVIQHFNLISPSDPTRTSTMPTDTRTVISLSGNALPNYGKIDQKERYNSGPLRRLAKGEEYKVHHLGRMPDHDFLRPSTSEWSESAIRVRHEISLEVTYQVFEDAPSRSKSRDRGKSKEKEKDDLYKPKKLVISQPLTLFSVSFFFSALLLDYPTDCVSIAVLCFRRLPHPPRLLPRQARARRVATMPLRLQYEVVRFPPLSPRTLLTLSYFPGSPTTTARASKLNGSTTTMRMSADRSSRGASLVPRSTRLLPHHRLTTEEGRHRILIP